MKRSEKFYRWLIPVTLIALIGLSACGTGAAAPGVDPGPIFTQVAATSQALQTQVAQDATVIAGNNAPSSPALAATPTLPPTPTQQPTDTLQPTPTPPPTVAPAIPPASTNTPVPTVKYVPVPQNITEPGANGAIPNMSVTLIANDQPTYSIAVRAGASLIFRAQVENTSLVPLQVVANLSVPDGWDVDQNSYSDCPTTEDLDQGSTCTISWYFTPQGSGQIAIRVYVRGLYTDDKGNTSRITDSPAIIFNVLPAKS